MVDASVGSSAYEIVIRGELDARYAHLFDGMRMEQATGTTVLTGSVRDRAELYGYIDRIEELGLELLSVQQIGASDVESTQEARA